MPKKQTLQRRWQLFIQILNGDFKISRVVENEKEIRRLEKQLMWMEGALDSARIPNQFLHNRVEKLEELLIYHFTNFKGQQEVAIRNPAIYNHKEIAHLLGINPSLAKDYLIQKYNNRRTQKLIYSLIVSNINPMLGESEANS